MKFSFVYIITNKKDGVLYIGVTSDLIGRIYQHKHKLLKGFSAKYNLDKLVYYEVFEDVLEAIAREKKLKHFPRSAKVGLIESFNPSWRDLYFDLAK
jgi:putative endonuclease